MVLFGKIVIHLQFQATLILLLLILSITAMALLKQATQLSTKALLKSIVVSGAKISQLVG